MTKWTPALAAAFLAAGWVHYFAVLELGGNPALVVVWLVLFLATAAIAVKQALDQGKSFVMSPYVSGRRSR